MLVVTKAVSETSCNNPNVFFTANELYQKIWGRDSLGDVRTVQVHIHNLRGKTEPDPAKPVYLKGYVFCPKGPESTVGSQKQQRRRKFLRRCFPLYTKNQHTIRCSATGTGSTMGGCIPSR